MKTEKEVFFPLSQYSKELFQFRDVDADSYSALALAFIGDSVYELMIRSIVLNQYNTNVNILNRKTSMLAKATTQAKMLHLLVDSGILREREIQVYKRGRNAKSATPAKHATIQEYRTATGLEALFGWLYLKGEHERMEELMKLGLDYLKNSEGDKKQ